MLVCGLLVFNAQTTGVIITRRSEETKVSICSTVDVITGSEERIINRSVRSFVSQQTAGQSELLGQLSRFNSLLFELFLGQSVPGQ